PDQSGVLGSAGASPYQVKGTPDSGPSIAPPPPPAGSEIGAPPAAIVSASPRLPPSASSPAVPLLAVPLRLLGVIGKLYVVLESDRGLVLLDQHAAHERILFEQMLA